MSAHLQAAREACRLLLRDVEAALASRARWRRLFRDEVRLRKAEALDYEREIDKFADDRKQFGAYREADRKEIERLKGELAARRSGPTDEIREILDAVEVGHKEVASLKDRLAVVTVECEKRKEDERALSGRLLAVAAELERLSLITDKPSVWYREEARRVLALTGLEEHFRREGVPPLATRLATDAARHKTEGRTAP